MNAPPHHAPSHRFQDVFANPQVQAGLITAPRFLNDVAAAVRATSQPGVGRRSHR